MNLFKVTFVSFGLALLISWVCAMLACSLGFLFAGIDTFVAVVGATGFSTITTLATAHALKNKRRHFGWRTIIIETALLALVTVGLSSWWQTRQNLVTFFNHAPVPGGVQVHHGHNNLFAEFVHFTAQPKVISTIIQSKELVAVPAEEPDGDSSAYWERQKSQTPRDWWQPATMSNPKFFYRYHKTDMGMGTGWAEGWWVNDATNEVYAFISG
jgi:hypothetical protein